MNSWLVKTYIKDYKGVNNNKVREKYGALSSIIGILLNLILFVAKYVIGTLSNSITIISDAFNNLSDSANCIITLFGYKMAAKPADKDHPFGHGRVEYLTSLGIAIVIIFVGVELMKTSITKIMNPEKVIFSYIVVAMLILSIIVKLWMFIFNNKLGKYINSSILIATAQDSKNDMIATSVAIVSIISSLFTDLPVDGVLGVVVSCFVIYSGYDIVKDTVDVLIGKPMDVELVKELEELMLSDKHILGTHDLIVHNYGPGNLIGSAHAEVSVDENILEIHDAIDMIEKEIYERFNILMTLHIDPLELNNEYVNKCRSMIKKIVVNIYQGLTIHDFRVVKGPTHTNLIFDVLVPYDCKCSNTYIKEKIDEQLSNEHTRFYTVIIFDKKYC